MAAILGDQLLELDAALDAAGIPHAFGGAIALAYFTLEPRGTRDLDVNVFVDQEQCAAALAALPAGVQRDGTTVERIVRDGQIRLWWDDTPIDLFFDNVPVHRQAARHVRRVPFGGRLIPVLGPIELVVFKAMFDRTKDWADIEAVLEAEAVDVDAVRETLAAMLPPEDRRFARLDEALAEIQRA